MQKDFLQQFLRIAEKNWEIVVTISCFSVMSILELFDNHSTELDHGLIDVTELDHDLIDVTGLEHDLIDVVSIKHIFTFHLFTHLNNLLRFLWLYW